MGYFYIDDSVHTDAGFIIAACLYCSKDLSQSIHEIFYELGIDPNITEYKSGVNYKMFPEMGKVRSKMKSLLQDTCKFGVVVLPSLQRPKLGIECLKAVKIFLVVNAIDRNTPIHFDEGMFPSKTEALATIIDLQMNPENIHLNQDSLLIKGIQLADLVAHMTSIMLKARMGLIKKMVKAGKNSGYDEDSEMELEFELWATIRYNFFHEKSKIAINDPLIDMTFKVEPYGLYVSSYCDESLAALSRSLFEEVYLGCIH